MPDLSLNPANRDLLVVGGDLALNDGVDAIAQALRIRLLTFKGEWFLDRRIGVPYREQIFSNRLKRTLVDTIWREAILASPGISSIQNFVSDFNPRTRVYSLVFSAITVKGERIEFNEPFILDVSV